MSTLFVGRYSLLTDNFNRQITKLRVSITDKCNLKCRYCNPGDSKIIGHQPVISKEKLIAICREIVAQGVSEIRITGGEPTVHPEFIEITKALSELPIKKLGITSNGVMIDKYLEQLIPLRPHLNFSLDGMSADTFHKATGLNLFDRVMHSILNAKNLGFPVKINTVLMRGINDHEIESFMAFSAIHGIEVRFLELMKIGVAREFYAEKFISSDEILNRISARLQITGVTNSKDATAVSYEFNNGAKIGFIASETKPFCKNCSRLRLDSKGNIWPCLLSNRKINIAVMDEEQRLSAIKKAISFKPLVRAKEVDSEMAAIGG